MPDLFDDARVEPFAGGGAMGEQSGRRVGGIGHRGEPQNDKASQRGVGDEADGRTEHQCEGALASDQGARHIEAPLGQQMFQGVARHLPAETAQLGADCGQVVGDQLPQRRQDAICNVTWPGGRPEASAREPQALLPTIPPIVHRLCVLGSGPNRSPCGRAAACSWACTTPGSTTASEDSGSTCRIRVRCRLVSRTTPGPTALPAIDVPAPRTVSGTASCRHTSNAASISSTWRGRTTAWGNTRYREASDEYSARARAESSTSAIPAARRAALNSAPWVSWRGFTR